MIFLSIYVFNYSFNILFIYRRYSYMEMCTSHWFSSANIIKHRSIWQLGRSEIIWSNQYNHLSDNNIYFRQQVNLYVLSSPLWYPVNTTVKISLIDFTIVSQSSDILFVIFMAPYFSQQINYDSMDFFLYFTYKIKKVFVFNNDQTLL